MNRDSRTWDTLVEKVKIKLRDLLILKLYFLGVSRLRNLIFRLRGEPLTRVLVFHRIADEDVEAFRTKLEWLKARYHVIGLDDYFERRNLSIDKINVALTFDDGFSSWKENVIPVLKELELPATLFIPSGFIGLPQSEAHRYAAERLGIRPTGSLCWEDLREITQDGFEIGGHTVGHVDLGVEGEEGNLEAEVVEDKAKIETELGDTVCYFAYPFGDVLNYSERAIETVCRTGYHGAFTIVPGFNRTKTDRYRLHRDSLDVGMSYILFQAWIEGSYDYLKAIANWIRVIQS
ncbi:MAG: polysaccharide deacetylase family protein [Candidatus Bipolaricaulia bacterium]